MTLPAILIALVFLPSLVFGGWSGPV